jgi:metal-responsive CopG/Arc/MetJ family transcriptional regulator
MSDEKDPRIITPMPQRLVDAIDDYRFSNRLASRAEAIRQLIALGLQSASVRSKTKA